MAMLGHLGARSSHLGVTLGDLGAMLGCGPSLEPSWAYVGLSWAILEPCWAYVGPSWAIWGLCWDFFLYGAVFVEEQKTP